MRAKMRGLMYGKPGDEIVYERKNGCEDGLERFLNKVAKGIVVVICCLFGRKPPIIATSRDSPLECDVSVSIHLKPGPNQALQQNL